MRVCRPRRLPVCSGCRRWCRGRSRRGRVNRRCHPACPGPTQYGGGVPPVRWVPESSGAVNPAWAITYAVRPEQSKPIWVPQELYWPPPRAQPLVGPEEPAPRPAARRTPRKPSTTATPAEVTPAAEPGLQRRAAHNPDAKPGEEHPGEATFKLTVNVPVSLHQRAAGVVQQPGQVALSAALKGRVANVRLSEPQPDRIRLIDVELHTTGEHLDCYLPADRESINVADTPCGGARGDAVGCGKLDG